MEFFEQFELEDCPICGGTGLLEEENHCGFSVSCLDCGGVTVTIDFKTEEGKLEAAKRAADLWNTGKVIPASPGE